MNPLDHPLLLDQNIHRDVAQALREQGRDVVTVEDLGMAEAADRAILATALEQRRVVVTHDSDFGTLTVRAGHAFLGIIYLRPGHINPAFVLGSLAVIADSEVDACPPFILVAKRQGDQVRLRLRLVPTGGESR